MICLSKIMLKKNCLNLIFEEKNWFLKKIRIFLGQRRWPSIFSGPTIVVPSRLHSQPWLGATLPSAEKNRKINYLLRFLTISLFRCRVRFFSRKMMTSDDVSTSNIWILWFFRFPAPVPLPHHVHLW